MSLYEESENHLALSTGRVLVCIVLSLSFAVGVPGNTFVIWTICGRMKQRSPAVMLILNLAVADLLVLVTLPVWIHSFANAWLLGLAACKAMVFVVYCNMYASIFLITALSLERVMAVFCPFVVQRRTNNTSTRIVMLLIWLLAIAFGAAILPFQETDETDIGTQCTSRSYVSNSQKVGLLLLETLVGFLVPFAIISICYVCIAKRISHMTGSRKQRSTRLVTSVVVAFALCWLPYHTFNLMSIASAVMEDSYKEASEALEEIAVQGTFIAGSVAFLSSCINPVLYAFAARNFQSSVRLAKLSKLFEQISPGMKPEATKELSVIEGREEALTSAETI
ncbi:leukotriene B4 receptor 1-like [Sphaerodactylus townsendi]|uniref:leukotriene B4 receptor 1-like n=1 Tax=Sphaerodactylus townsendi TaxID=933632 RepID=UPI002026C37D|nr:leukotriene B4 receptor 1-like [Sphaerodactylus townsendi]